MNIEQLSTQIVAINDAIQILARNGTSVAQHTKEIDGLLQKTGKNDERLREIESLIHQSCELKSKEMSEQAKDIYDTMRTMNRDSKDFTKYVAAAIASVGIGMFYYVFNTITAQSAEHTEFEIRQEEKSDKLFNEIFGVMRTIQKDVSDMKSDLAVLHTNQGHYQKKLDDHMISEEEVWRKAK